jgi:hypothetical protein
LQVQSNAARGAIEASIDDLAGEILRTILPKVQLERVR